MLFNTLSFACFLLVTYTLYVFVFSKSLKIRNLFILAASYFFYGCWNYKLLLLIFGISIVDFLIANKIQRFNDAATEDNDMSGKKKPFLYLALFVNLGVLAYFKYCNFFMESFWSLFALVSGSSSAFKPLDIILPVGISFYCFQGLSYVIDVYKRKIESCKNPVVFCAFISFFPQLIAGPIERAGNLLPQFDKPFEFSYDEARMGFLNIGIGLIKKMLIADRLAVYVDAAYGNMEVAKGMSAVVAIIFFAFQLYLDFSAYSQIAIGTAQLFGFKLTQNFKRPYLSTSFKQFWSRWHITLTNWFRDYLYFTLGGNRKGKYRTYLNVIIVFAVSGLWHGASWNFVIWGLLNGIFLAVFDKMFHLDPQTFFKKVVCCLFVCGMWALSLAFFRAETFGGAITMLGNIFSSSTASLYDFGLNSMEFKFVVYLIIGLMVAELFKEKWEDKVFSCFFRLYLPIRMVVYILIPLAIIYLGIYGEGNDNSFIYFQF